VRSAARIGNRALNRSLLARQPGTSVFLQDDDRIFHTYSSYARGGDLLLGTYNYLDLTPLGRQLYVSEFSHHDEYETKAALAGNLYVADTRRDEPVGVITSRHWRRTTLEEISP
jgi:hypothetical protein